MLGWGLMQLIACSVLTQQTPQENMKFLIVLAAIAAVASAGLVHTPYASTIVRAPSFDSAVIKSDRIGGNFAYSTAENHAYAAVSPVVSHVPTPVAVSYSAPAIHAAPIAYAGLHHGIHGYAGLHGGYAGIHGGYAGIHGGYAGWNGIHGGVLAL